MPASTESIRELVINRLETAGLREKQVRTRTVEIPDVAEVVSQIAGDEGLLILVELKSDKKQAFIKSSTNKIQDAVTCPTLVVLR